jgi:hypothetical protein
MRVIQSSTTGIRRPQAWQGFHLDLSTGRRGAGDHWSPPGVTRYSCGFASSGFMNCSHMTHPAPPKMVIRSTGTGLFITAVGHVIQGAGLSITAPIALFRSARFMYRPNSAAGSSEHYAPTPSSQFTLTTPQRQAKSLPSESTGEPMDTRAGAGYAPCWTIEGTCGEKTVKEG